MNSPASRVKCLPDPQHWVKKIMFCTTNWVPFTNLKQQSQSSKTKRDNPSPHRNLASWSCFLTEAIRIQFLQGTNFLKKKYKYREKEILALWGNGGKSSVLYSFKCYNSPWARAYELHGFQGASPPPQPWSCFLAFKLLCNHLSLNVDSIWDLLITNRIWQKWWMPLL